MYGGVWDTIEGILTNVGVTGESATAIIRAFASPTIENIELVKMAFANAGTSPPPELMNTLYGRYAQSVKDNPYMTAGITAQTITDWLPYVIGGGLLIWALSSRRRK